MCLVVGEVSGDAGEEVLEGLAREGVSVLEDSFAVVGEEAVALRFEQDFEPGGVLESRLDFVDDVLVVLCEAFVAGDFDGDVVARERGCVCMCLGD